MLESHVGVARKIYLPLSFPAKYNVFCTRDSKYSLASRMYRKYLENSNISGDTEKCESLLHTYK